MQRERGQRDLGELMAAAQSGDRAAYRAMLEAVIPVLRATIRNQLQHLQPSDLEDLVQETLLSIHQVRATYDPRRPFLPWVRAIARNRSIDWARRQTRRKGNETTDNEAVETFAAEEPNNDRTVGDPEALRHAITQLPSGQRRAVELLKLKEMSLREASEVTGTSISALKVACHRAIKALRTTLLPNG